MYRYKLITFDITGTILKLKQPPGVHYARAGALFGIKANPEVLTKSFKRQWKHLNTQKPNFGASHNGWEEWWSDVVHGTFKDAGVCNDKKILDGIASHLIDKYTTSSCWEHCDGAINLLTNLKYNRVPIGVVSNFDTRLHTIMENLHIKHFFDFVITSYDFGYPKPDRRIFEEALNTIKSLKGHSLDPSSILHVGDTPEIDCKGASRAGWNTWLVTNKESKNTFNSDDEENNNEAHLTGNLQQLHDHLLKTSEKSILKQ